MTVGTRVVLAGLVGELREGVFVQTPHGDPDLATWHCLTKGCSSGGTRADRDGVFAQAAEHVRETRHQAQFGLELALLTDVASVERFGTGSTSEDEA